MKTIKKNMLAACIVAPVALTASAGFMNAHADTFILVHGAFQDATSWDAVSELLVAAGHDVVAVDLPGRDATGDEAKAISLDLYADTVAEAVNAASAPTFLVGHSFAGMTISAVAERDPERIDKLIYVAAYVPESGESMEALALSDSDNRFTAETFVISPDYAYAEILEGDQVRVFAQDADDAQADALQASMRREPLAPIGTAVELTEARFGVVPKAYIRTLDDGTVSTPLQTMMLTRAGIEDVRDIESGHAPHLTRPEALAAAILELAQ